MKAVVGRRFSSCGRAREVLVGMRGVNIAEQGDTGAGPCEEQGTLYEDEPTERVHMPCRAGDSHIITDKNDPEPGICIIPSKVTRIRLERKGRPFVDIEARARAHMISFNRLYKPEGVMRLAATPKSYSARTRS
jgi:hypothetical protein